jgi:hypothetical protein
MATSVLARAPRRPPAASAAADPRCVPVARGRGAVRLRAGRVLPVLVRQHLRARGRLSGQQGRAGLFGAALPAVRVPQATPYAFPFACLFGTLLGFGRLAADNEITALRTSGVSFWRIIRLPLLAGVAVALAGSFLINEHVAPVATDLSTRSFYQILYKSQTLPIEPNIFRADPATGNTFYIQSVSSDGKAMQNVEIYQPDRTALAVRTDADRQECAHRRHGHRARARRARRSINADGRDREPSTSLAHEVRLSLPMGDNGQNFLSSAFNDTYTMNTKRLSQDIKFRKADGPGRHRSGGARADARHEVRLSVRRVHRGDHRAAAGGAVREERPHARGSSSRSCCSSSTTRWSRWRVRSAETARSIPTWPRGCRTSSWAAAGGC